MIIGITSALLGYGMLAWRTLVVYMGFSFKALGAALWVAARTLMISIAGIAKHLS